MRNLLEITINKEDYSRVVEEYEEAGFSLIYTKHISSYDISLTFEGDRESVAELSRHENHHAFLEFEDGQLSPLYIKRERNFWED